MKYTVDVIKEGYSYVEGNSMKANGTCTLIRGGGINIVVDTLSAWDRDFLVDALGKRSLNSADVNFVVCTHGHSDHVGNLNLFQAATHIVGKCISKHDSYQLDAFEKDEAFCIAEDLYVVPTPGHTLTDVTVFVSTQDFGTVAITGDLFEKAEDLQDPSLWKETAGSENPMLQAKNRQMVLQASDHIVPGHGPMFQARKMSRSKVTKKAAVANNHPWKTMAKDWMVRGTGWKGGGCYRQWQELKASGGGMYLGTAPASDCCQPRYSTEEPASLGLDTDRPEF